MLDDKVQMNCNNRTIKNIFAYRSFFCKHSEHIQFVVLLRCAIIKKYQQLIERIKMKHSELKPTTKADLEAAMLDRRKKEVRRDLQEIDNVNNERKDLLSLHRYLDGKYQFAIADWGKSMFGYIKDQGFDYENLGEEALIENLSLMKPKLEAYMWGWNDTPDTSTSQRSTNVNVTVNNDVSITVTFEQVRSQIEEMTYLTNEQTQEILDKITEIEEALSDNGSKKSKWEKVKPVLAWLIDKSVDVGIPLLSLILKLKD